MSQANQGDTIKINYTGKFEDGTVFDSSEDKEPLEFTAGEGQMIEGVDDAVIGMSVGDKKMSRCRLKKGTATGWKKWSSISTGHSSLRI